MKKSNVKNFKELFQFVWKEFKEEVEKYNQDPYREKGIYIKPSIEQFFHWIENGYFNEQYN